MGFLAPLALVALAAVAVPVWIHLSQRDRKEEVRFPSLMFLERIPYKAVRRQTIRNWPLFLVRALVVVLLVGAFARPFFGGDVATAAGAAGPVDRVILVDRSMSMSAGDRWSTALRMAREAAREVGPGSRVGLVLFDERASVAVPLSGEAGPLLAVLDSVGVGYGATRFTPALQAAATLLEETGRSRDVVLITDAQATGWPEGSRYRLPEGIALTVRTPGEPESATHNPRLSGLRITTRQGEGDTTWVRASALLAGLPGAGDLDGPDTPIPVSLWLDGREVAVEEVIMDGRTSVGVSLEGPLQGPSAAPEETGSGAPGFLAMNAPGISGDDTLRFVASPPARIPVLVADDSGESSASLFLSRALGVGRDPAFPAEVVAPSRIDDSVLRGVTVLVLNDVPAPAGQALAAIRTFLERGGGAWVVLGPDAGGEWPQWLVPGGLGPAQDLGDARGVTLSDLALDHPILEPFREAGAGEFSRARFFRTRGMDPDSTAEVVASYIDGQPALLETRAGEGRVVVWTSTLDDFWTDLPRQAVFLPFVHQVVQYVGGYRPLAAAHEVGAPLAPLMRERLGRDPGAWSAVGPGGEALPGGEATFLDRAGFYQVEAVGPEATSGVTEEASFLLAANPDPAESELAPLDPEALVRQVSGGDASPGSDPSEVLTVREREARQAIWRILLLALMGLLVAETVLANRPRARVS